MKKILTLAMVCLSAMGAAMAQDVSIVKTFDSTIEASPATLCNGKSFITVETDNGIDVYDNTNGFNLVTSIGTSYTSDSNYGEKATVTLSGAELDTYDSGNPHYEPSHAPFDISNITTSQQLADALNNAEGSTDYIAVTIPGTSYPAVARSGNGFMSEVFGTRYPTWGYCVMNGSYYQFDASYSPTYDASEVTWTIEETPSTSTKTTVQSLNYYDADSFNRPDTHFYISKTLFNDDDKWEWVEQEIGTPHKSYSYYLGSQVSGNQYEIHRRVYVSTPVTGLKIMSESGTLVTLDGVYRLADDVLKVNNKIYFITETISSSARSYDLWEYTPVSTSAKIVLSNIDAKSKQPAKILNSDGTISIRAIDGKVYTTAGAEIK